MSDFPNFYNPNQQGGDEAGGAGAAGQPQGQPGMPTGGEPGSAQMPGGPNASAAPGSLGAAQQGQESKTTLWYALMVPLLI